MQVLTRNHLGSQAEINQLDLGVECVGFVNKILWFDVPMADAELVEVFNRRYYVFGRVSGSSLVVVLTLAKLQTDVQVLARAQLHNQMQILCVLVDLKKFDDVWMVNFLHYIKFVSQLV